VLFPGHFFHGHFKILRGLLGFGFLGHGGSSFHGNSIIF